MRKLSQVLIVVLLLSLAGSALSTSSGTADRAAPGARHGFAAAYDARSGGVLVFGGSNHLLKPPASYNDTWTWDGARWRWLSEAGPAPRIWPAAAYHPKAKRFFLFGGASPGGERVLGDTWRFDHGGWTEIKPAVAPAPRWHFAMVTDEARGQLVLFGGVDHTQKPAAVVFGDTWVWEGAAWRKVAATGPAPRFGHAMAFDRKRRTVILVGGRDREQRPLGDTWEWNGQEWKAVAATGLTPRLLHGLAFDERRQALLLFGGWNTEDGNYLGDTWTLNGSQWTALPASGPPPLRAHMLVADVRRQRVVLFGGYTATAVSRAVWEWDGQAWTRR